MTGEKVAVVGGTGYLGSTIVRELLARGYAPVVLARNPEKAKQALPGVQVETRRADVCDLAGLRTALQGCAMVHSVAALLTQVFSAATPTQEEEAVRTNVEGTLNVLRAAHELGAQRVLVTGTCTVRYTPGGKLAGEDSPPTDLKLVNDPYVRSKLRAEAAIGKYAQETGLSVVQLLPGALIGPGDRGPTPLNAGVLERLNGVHNPSIEGGFPIVDVRDAARAHVAAMEAQKPHPAYLLVAQTIPSREWHGLITRLAGTPPLERFLSPRMAMLFASIAEVAARMKKTAPPFTRNSVRHIVQQQQYDCSRAKRELGIAFTPVETSMRDMIRFYVENGFVTHAERLTLA